MYFHEFITLNRRNNFTNEKVMFMCRGIFYTHYVLKGYIAYFMSVNFLI